MEVKQENSVPLFLFRDVERQYRFNLQVSTILRSLLNDRGVYVSDILEKCIDPEYRDLLDKYIEIENQLDKKYGSLIHKEFTPKQKRQNNTPTSQMSRFDRKCIY